MKKGHWNTGRGGWYALRIAVRKQSLSEFLMSQREMRRYWGEPHAPLYYPLSCFSRWLKIKKTK